MNKFLVAIDVGTREQRNAVTEIFQKKDWKLWHWMEDVWLLSQVPDEVTSKAVSDELESHPLIGKKAKVIIRISASGQQTYFGHSVKEAWDWMAQFWGTAG